MMNLNRAVRITNAYTIKIQSPEGAIFVHCNEDINGKLDSVMINVGKAGSTVSSWANGLSRMISIALRSTDLSEILTQLSNNSSDRSVLATNKIFIKSGVDAVFHALLMYKNLKVIPYHRLPSLSIPPQW